MYWPGRTVAMSTRPPGRLSKPTRRPGGHARYRRGGALRRASTCRSPTLPRASAAPRVWRRPRAPNRARSQGRQFATRGGSGLPGASGPRTRRCSLRRKGDENWTTVWAAPWSCRGCALTSCSPREEWTATERRPRVTRSPQSVAYHQRVAVFGKSFSSQACAFFGRATYHTRPLLPGRRNAHAVLRPVGHIDGIEGGQLADFLDLTLEDDDIVCTLQMHNQPGTVREV